MKTLLALLGVAVIAMACWALLHRYEFHTDTFHAYEVSYPVIWRCDRLTGIVEESVNGGAWQKIKKPESAWSPPASDPIISSTQQTFSADEAEPPTWAQTTPVPPKSVPDPAKSNPYLETNTPP